LQAWRLRRLVAAYPRRVVRHRYGDAEPAVELADPLAEAWYDFPLALDRTRAGAA
jgi:hypothetical protein